MQDPLDADVDRWVTDGGLETDLLFNKGVDLPDFAAFPLLEDVAGRRLLEDYLADYVAIAAAAGAGVILETPTWRANPDWGARLGYDADALDRLNREAVALVRRVADRGGVPTRLVSGNVGPRGDGYVAGGDTAEQAAAYHLPQVRSLVAGGADLVHAMTISTAAEALGVVRAAREVGVTVAVSLTVETDGTLPDGTPLGEAIRAVDEAGGPDWFGVNCAHPAHVLPAVADGSPEDAWRSRVRSFRPNASTLTHAELDAMTELDAGDVDVLVTQTDGLRRQLPAVRVVGGCCGTDARHVAALWRVPAPASS